MIGMNLREIIKAAAAEHASTPEILQAIRRRMKSHPGEINEKGLLNLTACHAAILANQPHILECLVLEGDGALEIDNDQNIKPEDLACDQRMELTIGELRKESLRRLTSRVFHLHDYIHMLATRPELKKQMQSLIIKRIAEDPKQVNERTYWGRTACHWAMVYGLTDLLPLLIKEGKADLTFQDLDGKIPMEVVNRPIDENTQGSDEVVFNRFSKKAFEAIYADFEEGRASRSVSINCLTDSLSQLKLHHVDHDNQVMMESESSSLAPLHCDSAESRSVKQRSNRSKKENLLGGLSLHDEIKKDNVDFMRQYLHEGNDPNASVTLLGMPLLHFAFVQGKKKVFRLLLSHGASLSGVTDPQNIDLIDLNLSYHSKNGLRFLIEMRNSFINSIDMREIKRQQERLTELEQAFHSKLMIFGLSANMPSSAFTELTSSGIKDIADLHHLPPALVQMLYEMCSCIHSQEESDEHRHFSPKRLSQLIAALRTEFKPPYIAFALKQLCAHFSLNQQLVAYFLIKEMIIQDEYTAKELQRYFVLNSVPLFCEKVCGGVFDDLKKYFPEMIAFKQSDTMRELKAYYQLDAIISRHIVYTEDASFLHPSKNQSAKLLANEFRALTLQFYHLVHVDEFVSQHWQSPDKEKRAPHICQHQRMFEKCSHFIKHQILSASSKKERLALLTLWIDTITELLKDPLPDYDGAMMIFCSLSHSSIFRLKDTFDSLSKNTKAAFSAVEQTLSPDRNFGNMRRLLRENPMSMPFFGLMLRDVTYAYENKKLSDRMPVLGPILKDFILCQNRLKMIHLPLKTDMAFHIQRLNEGSAESLHALSIRIEAPPLTEKDLVDNEKCRRMLGIYVEQRFPLCIETQDDILKEEAAFKFLFNWIRNRCRQGLVDFVDAQEMLQLAWKTVAPAEEYWINPVYFHGAPPQAEPLIAQFSNHRQEGLAGRQALTRSQEELKHSQQHRHH